MLRLLALLVVALLSNGTVRAQQYQWSNFAGLPGGAGNVDGTGSVARFYEPGGVAMDGSGNVYVADTISDTIRKVTSAGVVTTFAGIAGKLGSTDGTGSTARFFRPNAVALDGSGNLYVADTDNHTIRKITSAGVVTTLAGLAGTSGSTDGTGSAARFKSPKGVAVDGSGNVYVADTSNSTIRQITPAGVVSTLAGLAGSTGSTDGTGSTARFKNPEGVAVDGSGSVYVADTGSDTIRKITQAGVVSTFAGTAGNFGYADGAGSAAKFAEPTSLALDGAGIIYVADSINYKIRKITPSGVVSTLVTTDGTGSPVGFTAPNGVAVDVSGNICVADTYNQLIRKVTPAGVVTNLAGLAPNTGRTDGTGSAARFDAPQGVAVDGSGNVYVVNTSYSSIRKITSSGVVTTFAGGAGQGSADGTGSTAHFNIPYGVAADGSGNVYVADTNNNTVRKITPGGVVSTLAGLALASGSTNGTGSAARFRKPRALAVDVSGNVYVADTGNHTIRKITPAGVVTTLAGLALAVGNTDGMGSTARFRSPDGVAVDTSGNIYVADTGNFTIRKITSAGVVTTLAGLANVAGSSDGTGSTARFEFPEAVAVDGSGNVYVADYNNHTIRRVTPAGVVTTIGGTAGVGSGVDGLGREAMFFGPVGIAVAPNGTLFMSDVYNNCVFQGILNLTQYTVTPGADQNGSVSPNTGQAVYIGEGVGFTAAPDSGYAVNQWLLNWAVAQTGGNNYTLGNVKADAAVQVTFSQTAIGAWRQLYFGSPSNAGQGANTADPYHTGVPNLTVFAVLGPNQDPARVVFGLLPQPQITGGNYVVTFTEPAGVSGVTYGAEWAADLSSGSWTPIGDTGSGTTHKFSVPMGGHAMIFMRLRVSSP